MMAKATLSYFYKSNAGSDFVAGTRVFTCSCRLALNVLHKPPKNVAVWPQERKVLQSEKGLMFDYIMLLTLQLYSCSLSSYIMLSSFSSYGFFNTSTRGNSVASASICCESIMCPNCFLARSGVMLSSTKIYILFRGKGRRHCLLRLHT